MCLLQGCSHHLSLPPACHTAAAAPQRSKELEEELEGIRCVRRHGLQSWMQNLCGVGGKSCCGGGVRTACTLLLGLLLQSLW